MGYDVYLVDPGGCHQSGDLVALCRGSTAFPSSGVHVSIRAKNVGLVPRYPLQKPPSRGLEGSGGDGGGVFPVFTLLGNP